MIFIKQVDDSDLTFSNSYWQTIVSITIIAIVTAANYKAKRLSCRSRRAF
ncbi:hypothetical protein [Pontibacter populi]|uniref:Uncharacterized protein n=1 Tax=Pontibacter populi TaxID=890055 RepID=A0ABV1RV30_9BACT